MWLDFSNADVKKLLSDAQRTAIVSEVNRKQEELRLGNEKLKEEVNRQIFEAQILTLNKGVELEGAKREIAMARVVSTVDLDKQEKVGRATNEAEALAISSTANAAAAGKEWELERAAMEAKVTAFAGQMHAMSPELIATLKVLGNQNLAAELSRNVSPLAILGGGSVAEVVERLLGALPMGTDGVIRNVLPIAPARPPKGN